MPTADHLHAMFRPHLLLLLEPRLAALSDEVTRMWASARGDGRVQRTASVDEVAAFMSDPDVWRHLEAFDKCGS